MSEDEIDAEFERITAANPDKMAKLTAWIDAELAVGNFESMDSLMADESR